MFDFFNGGTCFLPYFLCFAILTPILMSLVFLLNRNSLLHRAAAFFMSAVLLSSTGWAIRQGTGVYQPAGLLAGVLDKFFVVGIAGILLGAAYWSWRSKDRLLGSLTLAQGIIFGGVLWKVSAIKLHGSFVLDHLSALMLLLINGVGSMILLYAMRHMEMHERRRSLKHSRKPHFFAVFSTLLAAMNGFVLTNHLLGTLVFAQGVVVCSVLLIAHDRTQLAYKNARQFARMLSVGALAFLCGIYLILSAAGTLLISDLLLLKDANLLLPSFSCVVVAGLVFAGQFPFQSALIRATTAPVPVSAMLQSSAIVTAGVYLILRLSPVLMNTFAAKMLAVIGAFTFAAAALLAAMQHDTKRLLTLTTISNGGLVIVLASYPELQAIYAAPLLLVLHGIFKALIFLCIGSRSPSPIPGLLVALGGVSMFMPPFAVPLAQWTALESSVRNPAALGLIIAGSVFSMMVWCRFIGKRLPASFSHDVGARWNPTAYWPQLSLAFFAIALSVFIVPFANSCVTPILKENYGRFGDIAQGAAATFLIRNFSGVNPALLFGSILVLASLGWGGKRMLMTHAVVDQPAVSEVVDIPGSVNVESGEDQKKIGDAEAQEDSSAQEDGEVQEAAETQEERENNNTPEILTAPSELREPNLEELESKSLPELTEMGAGDEEPTNRPAAVPRCSVFAGFPDERKTYLYATIVAGALIILMLEVVFR